MSTRFRCILGGLCLLVATWTWLGGPNELRAGSLEEYQSEKHGSESSNSNDDEDDEDDEDDDDGSAAAEFAGELLGAIISGADGDGGSSSSNSEDDGSSEVKNCRYREFYTCRSQCERITSKCRKDCRLYANRLCGYASASIAMGSTAAPASTGSGAAEGVATPFYHLNWNRPSWMADLGLGFASNALLASSEIRLRYRYYGLGLRGSMLVSRTTWVFEGDVGPSFSWPLQSSIFTLRPSLLVSTGAGDPTRLGPGMRIGLQYYGPRLMLGGSAMGGYVPKPRFDSPGALNSNVRFEIGYRFTPKMFASIAYDLRAVQGLNQEFDPVLLHGALFSVGTRIN